MEALARLLVRRPVAWAIVAITLLLVTVASVFAGKVRQEDDLLAFLPAGSPEVAQFHAIAERFGGLDVALVGVETDDVFAPAFLERLTDATARLKGVQGVDRVLTLSNVQDFVEDPVAGGVRITDLIDRIPRDDADREALRAKVLSRDHVAGTLVSHDGRSVVLYCFIAWGSENRVVGDAIQRVATEVFPNDALYWGGAPFISTWVYETTQDDLARLVPWAVLVIVVITVLSFRNLFGAGLGLLATGAGILIARGVMGLLGVADNLVLASMPVVLFAVGSAYSIHILSRYYALVREGASTEDAVVAAVSRVGPTVLAAGGTTVVGLLSFVTMDIEPMRTFGVFSALGVFIAMIVAVTFVPAVVVLAHPRPYVEKSGTVERWSGAVMRWVLGHRGPVAGVLVVAGLVAAAGAVQVDSRVDDSAFFGKHTPPAQATAFLDTHFGGSRFLQVLVDADFSDPDVLREVQHAVDRIGAVEGVVDVQAAPRVVSLVNESMTGARRVPDSREQLGVLYGFLAGDPSVDQIVAAERDAGLLIVRLSAADVDAIERATDGVEATLAQGLGAYVVATDEAAAGWRVDVVAERITAMQRGRGEAVDGAALRARLAGPRPAADATHVEHALAVFLASDENFVPLEADLAARAAGAVAALGAAPSEDTLREALTAVVGPEADPLLADDLVLALAGPLPDAWRRASADAFASALVADGLVASTVAVEASPTLRGALMDLDLDRGLVPSEAPEARSIAWAVSGQPVIYEAMSRSVSQGQIKSLVYAMVLVAIILSLLFGSLWSGVLASMPMLVTLLFVYGVMGFAGVRLDLGASMIASLVIGAGVDYAVHLMAAWQAPDGRDLGLAAQSAADHTATAIWTNALMVAAGFAVLATGHAKPLQNVGSLVAAAMLAAAIATFVVVPLLARRARYSR